ncbi:hypothetical protein SS50377_26783 [Spironucleus salmonicida]|uniref:Uncharacterized protein n=1 Tax=Spironucleus salmonicida TaxID=348837 RepID=V6LX96_9EUKA|nr:hypothetical protein SS50377_26783 [Spironucleus salmonicida]|eukprot:EST49252.1 Hypothetical protein SS50377_10473 [Spironucleus salmonicida]
MQIKQEFIDGISQTDNLQYHQFMNEKAIQYNQNSDEYQISEVGTQTPSSRVQQAVQTIIPQITESTTITNFYDLFPQYKEENFLKHQQIQQQKDQHQFSILSTVQEGTKYWDLQKTITNNKSCYIIDGVKLPVYRKLSQSSFK